MKKICIIAAMQKEVELYLQKVGNYETKRINNREYYTFFYDDFDVVLCTAGVGKVCAALTCVELVKNFSADLIINMGVAGGIDNTLKIGDFIVADKFCYHDVWCGTPNAFGQVQGFPLMYETSAKLLQLFNNMKQGLICCGDQFISGEEKLMQIKHNFPTALAVDMESCAIAQTCYIYKKPFLCVRQISDVVGKHDNTEQYDEFWQNAPRKSTDILYHLLDKLKESEGWQ